MTIISIFNIFVTITITIILITDYNTGAACGSFPSRLDLTERRNLNEMEFNELKEFTLRRSGLPSPSKEFTDSNVVFRFLEAGPLNSLNS